MSETVGSQKSRVESAAHSTKFYGAALAHEFHHSHQARK